MYCVKPVSVSMLMENIWLKHCFSVIRWAEPWEVHLLLTHYLNLHFCEYRQFSYYFHSVLHR